MLHEVIEINVGTGILGKSQVKLDPDKDKIYEEIRDTPCSEVFPFLHKKAKLLKCTFICIYICIHIFLIIIYFSWKLVVFLMVHISGTE